jgi:hypothetical protein
MIIDPADNYRQPPDLMTTARCGGESDKEPDTIQNENWGSVPLVLDCRQLLR